MISDGDRESSDRCQHYLWSGQQDNIDKRTPVKINPRLGNQTPPANLLKMFLITILLQDIYYKYIGSHLLKFFPRILLTVSPKDKAISCDKPSNKLVSLVSQ